MVSNTLIFTNLSRDNFAEVSTTLVALLPEESVLVHWAELKSFRRIMAVFETAEMAVRVRHKVESTVFAASSTSNSLLKPTRIFYGLPTAIDVEQSNYNLKLPDAGRLWLLSPPPSPPVGWEPQEECEPNKETHFDIEHLRQALAQKIDSSLQEWSTESPEVARCPDRPKYAVLHESATIDRPNLKLDIAAAGKVNRDEPVSASSQISTPSIVVEWDTDDQPIVSQASHTSIRRTEMPPIIGH